MTIKEQTKLLALQNKEEKLKIKEEKQNLILQQKEDQKEQIKNYVFSHYEITKNSKDKIKSSYISEKINSTSTSFINTKKIKDILLSIDGITQQKNSYMLYCGLKER